MSLSCISMQHNSRKHANLECQCTRLQQAVGTDWVIFSKLLPRSVLQPGGQPMAYKSNSAIGQGMPNVLTAVALYSAPSSMQRG